MSTATHVVPPHGDDGPLPSVLENEVFEMSLQQDVNVQGPLYLNEQKLALANVLVLQSLKLSVLLQDAPRVIPRTICLSRYVSTLPV